MVELGVYAVARLYWVMFAGVLGPHVDALRAILVAAGVITALLGAWMCFVQRHLKRLLAFSTISHVGLFVCGVAMLGSKAIAGAAVYIVAHGLTKGALFMCMGVLLHRFGTVDEFDLHGKGRKLPFLGVLVVAGAVLLAAIPPFTAFAGKSLIESASTKAGYGWLIALFVVVAAATGGAVLRIAGRVFMGWGAAEGPDPSQTRAAHERVDETRDVRDHTPRTMMVVPSVLLVAAALVVFIPGAFSGVQRAAARFTDHAHTPSGCSVALTSIGPPSRSVTSSRLSWRTPCSRSWPRSASPRWACSDVRCATRCHDESASRRARRCASCATCIPARSAITSPGGPPGQACSGRCACSPSLE